MRPLNAVRIVGLCGLLAILGALAACTDSNEATACKTNAQCPEGQYCGSLGFCTLDCRKDSDCPGATCSSLGKCVGGPSFDGGGGDMEAGTSDLSHTDGIPDAPLVDQNPTVDLGAGPDRSLQTDLSVLPDMNLADLPPPDSWPYDAAPPDQGVVAPGTWKKLSAGTFSMGSPTTETCRNAVNEFLHQVTLSRAFEISTKEVTQLLYYQLMGVNPSKNSTCGGSCPVEGVTWHQAAAYCNALSKKASLTACYTCSGTGKATRCALVSAYAGTTSGSLIYGCPGFRLPTEAEWEYAARAGTSTSLYNGSLATCTGLDVNANTIAWYKGNASSIKATGLKKPNAWGLYDMSGNVLEWTHDWFQANLGTSAVSDPVGPATGTDHVVKGGSWNYAPSFLRPAYRGGASPILQINNIGFRCVRTSPPSPPTGG